MAPVSATLAWGTVGAALCPKAGSSPGGPGLTEIRKTFTPWSSVSMAVMRTLFSLALSICIWAHSLVLRISRRLPWVRITVTNKATQPWSPSLPHSQWGGHTLGVSEHHKEETPQFQGP